MKRLVKGYMDSKIFRCNKCGICCTKLNMSSIYDELDNGIGICKYFDISTKLCSIYEKRPEKCNVIAMYRYFEKMMTFDEYIKVNEDCCKRLKEM